MAEAMIGLYDEDKSKDTWRKPAYMHTLFQLLSGYIGLETFEIEAWIYPDR